MTLHKPRAKRPRSSMAAALSLALSVASAQESASQSGASASDILARCEALAAATTSTAALEDVQAPSEVLAVVGESEWTALRDVAKVGVLWEYGYVLSGSSSRLLKVYTRCSSSSSSSSSSGSGIEMAEIAVSQAAFSSVCEAADCGAFSQATNTECDDAGLSAALQCAVDVESQNVSSSSASVWSSAASSSAIPYPQAFRHNVSFNSTDSTDLVGIHMRATDAGVACTNSGDTIVPCFRLQDTVEGSTFCRPTVDAARVTAFLSAMSTVVAAQSTPSSDGSVFTGSTASESTSSPSSLSLAIAIAAGVIVLLLFVLGYCCLRRRKKRSASTNEANTVTMQAVGRRTDGGPERAQSRQRRWSTRPSWFGTLLGGGSERGRESTLNPTMRGRRSSSVGYGKTVEEYCAESADLTMFLNDTRIFTKRVAYEELTFLRLLAKGAFGEVWLGQLETQHVAIKKLLPERAHNTAHLEQFAAEIQLMAALEHPSVVSLLGVSWTRRFDTLSAVVEYMDGGDLDAALRRKGSQLSWRREKMRVAMDVAEGLVYLHCLRPVVVHRDLKSKNVLLSKTWRAKLSDFGVSRHAAVNETLTSGVGTLLWTAPEIIEGKKYSEKADIYSLGVVLSELDTAKPPFSHILNPDAETPGERLPAMQIARLVKLGKARVELRDDCPDALRQLALDCTALDPDRRPSAMQVAFTLKSIIAPALAQQGDSDEHQANEQVVPTPAS